MNISFQDVANSAGITYTGESYGAYWGDYNNDSLPDLWVTNHLSVATLYENRPNGTFRDVTSRVFDKLPTADLHGAAWADFDRDGDQDLLQQRASDFGGGFNRLYVNENGTLIDKADELGIRRPNRGSYPIWLDFDRDGLLDLNVNGGEREEAPPTIFRQTEDGVFEDANSLTGFNKSSTSFSVLSDLTGDGIPEIIFGGRDIFDTSTLPFTNVNNRLNASLIGNRVSGVTTADFNGDLLTDLYVTLRGRASDLFQDTSNSFKAYFRGASFDRGAQFTTTGDVTFELATKAAFVSTEDIKIGAGGFSPNDLRFTLSPDNPDVQGIAPHDPKVDSGVYIGYDAATEEWQILWSRPDRRTTYAFVDTENPISRLDAVGFDPDAQFVEDKLLINTPSGFVDRSEESGIAAVSSAGQNVVSGDFDNDMDVDIYVLNTTFAANRANLLYENQGDGTFTVVPNAGGAEGTLLGLGESVTVADYDVDGFLDVFTTNGEFFAGLGSVSREFYNDAPYQLFRNQGNNNHWLEIDLEGVRSNIDGIGAQVFVTAQGVTQLREQTGGVSQSQSFQRLHFGLADNTVANVVEVRWLSGVVQKLSNIDADQVLQVVEGIGLDNSDTIVGGQEADLLLGGKGRDFLRGSQGNDTLFGGDFDDELFGGADDDLLFGERGKDTLKGGGGRDTLDGGDLDDVLDGGAGNDVLLSGRGEDTITGGAGADTFVYTIPPDGRDIITDFEANRDIIDLSSIITGNNFSSSTPFEDYVFLRPVSGDTRVFIDQNGDRPGGRGRLIATLEDVLGSEIDSDNFTFG